MEITKEYFDQTIKNLATKADLHDLKTEIMARIDESQTELAHMVKRGFDDITTRLDVRTKVEELEQQMHEVREALSLV